MDQTFELRVLSVADTSGLQSMQAGVGALTAAQEAAAKASEAAAGAEVKGMEAVRTAVTSVTEAVNKLGAESGIAEYDIEDVFGIVLSKTPQELAMLREKLELLKAINAEQQKALLQELNHTGEDLARERHRVGRTAG
jgi:hypothetical protein